MPKILVASILLECAVGSTSAQAQARGSAKYCVQESGRGTSDNAPDCRYWTLARVRNLPKAPVPA